jgi:RimJ/RimL family protein N-acetyltransferase
MIGVPTDRQPELRPAYPVRTERLHRIVARLDERNEASARVARRLGMRQEARLVDTEMFKGEWSTELDFAMLAAEWPAHRDR